MDSSPLFIQKWMEPLRTTKTELQRHRTKITEHQTRWTVHLLDPIGELPRIGNGGGQRHQLDRRRTVNDRFFPDGSPLGIIHVMALIEHDRLHIGKRIVMLIRFCIQHVAENLGGHHHHPCLAVNAQVTGHQANIFSPKLFTKIAQLLIG